MNTFCGCREYRGYGWFCYCLGAQLYTADCVAFGSMVFGGDEPFDLVVSGINKGGNVGSSYFYSGTIGAAFQALVNGIPATAYHKVLIEAWSGGED